MKDLEYLRERSDQLEKDLDKVVNGYIRDIGDGLMPDIEIGFADVTPFDSDVKVFSSVAVVHKLNLEINL